MANPPEPTLAQREAMTESYRSFLHNTSLTMFFLAPALIALPPRKLDLYTATLAASFVASANHLTKERTGRGLLGNISLASRQAPATRLSHRDSSTAQEFSQKYEVGMEKEERRRRFLEDPVPSGAGRTSPSASPPPPSALEAKAKEIWTSGETEGWKEQRLREEEEKIRQGEGYGSMILDQIWEVWNWGENKGEEIKEKDKEVLYRREQEVRARKREVEFPTIGKDGR